MSSHGEQIILTGGSSEIGTAILRRLKASGTARVITTSNTKPITVSDSKWCLLRGVDLTQDAHLAQLRREVENLFTGPFSIIHSVGQFWEHKPLDRTPLSEAREMMLSHYFTLFGLAHSLLPLAAKRGGARIVAFSCNSVAYNYPEMAAFTSAKAAVESLVKCIANEWSKDGIVANALALPTIRTDAVLGLKPNGDHQNYITPDELAEVVLNVVHGASQYMNGNVIKLVKHSPTFYHEAYFSRNPPYPANISTREVLSKPDAGDEP